MEGKKKFQPDRELKLIEARFRIISTCISVIYTLTFQSF